MPIQVFVADEQSTESVDVTKWGALAERVLTDRGLTGDAELNVLFVDSAAIASLNRRFLGREGPTDVLSFPIEDDILATAGPPAGAPGASGPGRRGPSDDAGEPVAPTPGGPGGAPLLLGDVVICPEVASHNAPAHAGTYEDELALLLVHGILHLLGMDHEEDDEATEMETLERELLDRHHTRSGSAR